MSAARTPHEVRHEEQSVLSNRRGAPWWAVVLGALVLAAVGAGIDLGRSDDLGVLFRVLYVVGCVVAVLVVSRRGLFAAMVQPPLVLVVAVPLMAEVVGRAGRGGVRSTAIALALPLVNAFPTTAITTLVVLVLGGLRLVLRRRPRQAGPATGDGGGRKANADDDPTDGSWAAAGSWAGGGASSSPRNDKSTFGRRPPLAGSSDRAGGRGAARGPDPRSWRGGEQRPVGGTGARAPRSSPDGSREPRRYGPSSGAAPGGRNDGRAVPPLPANPYLPPAGGQQPAPGPRPDSWRRDPPVG